MYIQVSRKRYRYTGKEKDEETGLCYHGARYLMPWLGRWERPDPIGLGGGVNRYTYCRGEPVGRSDANGTRDTGVPTEFGTDESGQRWAIKGSAEQPAEEIEVRPGPTISAPEYDWIQAHKDLAAGRTTPAQYLRQYGGDGGILDIDYQMYRAWHVAATVAKGSWGNLTGTGRTDVSYEAAELIGIGLTTVGPARLARAEGAAVRGSTSPGALAPPGDPLLDNSVFSSLVRGDAQARAFAERRAGLLSIIDSTYDEALARNAVGDVDAVIQEFGILRLPDPPPGVVGALQREIQASPLRAGRNPTFVDTAVIAAARQHRIPLVTGDARQLYDALAVGQPALFRFFDPPAGPQLRIGMYSRVRANVPRYGADPYSITGGQR